MMKNVLIIVSIVFIFVGCSSTPVFKPSKFSRMEFLRENMVVDLEIENAIIEGKVIVGMSKEEVRAVWGDPQYERENEWDYKGLANIVVVFKNGVVIEVYSYT